MRKAIIGAGGFAREVYYSLDPIIRKDCRFFVEDEYYRGGDMPPTLTYRKLPISYFDPNVFEVVVAIADSSVRKRIVETLPKETLYFTHIHPSAIIMGDDVTIGEGSIICAGCILTTNINLGEHTHLNLGTTIGHDCNIGSYFTTAPGVMISGNCNIGERVYFGTMAMTKEKINICDDVIVGMNAGVTKDIKEAGTYIGTPAKLKV